MSSALSAPSASAKRTRRDSWSHSATDSDSGSDSSECTQAPTKDRNRRRRERRREQSGPNPRRLSRDVVRVLKKWMMAPEHYEHPYPDEAEKAALCAETGITQKQLTTWFTNARKRIWAPRRKARGEFVPRIFTSQHMEQAAGLQEAPAAEIQTTVPLSHVVPVSVEGSPGLPVPSSATQSSNTSGRELLDVHAGPALDVSSEANVFIDPSINELDLFPLDDLFADHGVGFTRLCEQIAHNLEGTDAVAPDFGDFDLSATLSPTCCATPSGSSVLLTSLLDVVPLLKLPNAPGIVPHSFASGFNGQFTPLLLANSQPSYPA